MKAAVVSNEKLTESVVALRFAPESPFAFKPGQFCSIMAEHDGKKVMKSYSIASHPSDSASFELCVKVVKDGFFSNYLASLKVGDEVELRAPLGHFVLQENLDNELIFMATGTGVSALKPMVEDAFLRGIKKDVWLFLGVMSEKDILYRKFFEGIESRHENFHFIPVLSHDDNPDFEHGFIQDAFRKLIIPGVQDVYICGLYAMVDDVKKLCADLGYPKEKLHFEKYI